MSDDNNTKNVNYFPETVTSGWIDTEVSVYAVPTSERQIPPVNIQYPYIDSYLHMKVDELLKKIEEVIKEIKELKEKNNE